MQVLVFYLDFWARYREGSIAQPTKSPRISWISNQNGTHLIRPHQLPVKATYTLRTSYIESRWKPFYVRTLIYAIEDKATYGNIIGSIKKCLKYKSGKCIFESYVFSIV